MWEAERCASGLTSSLSVKALKQQIELSHPHSFVPVLVPTPTLESAGELFRFRTRKVGSHGNQKIAGSSLQAVMSQAMFQCFFQLACHIAKERQANVGCCLPLNKN